MYVYVRLIHLLRVGYDIGLHL